MITDADVYQVVVECVGINPSTRSEIWNIEYKKQNSDSRINIRVEITDILASMLSFKHDEIYHQELTLEHEAFALARFVGYRYFVKGIKEDEIGLGSNHLDEFLEEDDYTERQLDHYILSYTWRFFKEYPNGELNEKDLHLSIRHKEPELKQRIQYWANRRYLIPIKDKKGTFIFDAVALDKIEIFETTNQGSNERDRYFKSVPLRVEFNVPYILVLMPFTDDKLTRKDFDTIIKPSVEEVTTMKCLRADDYQNTEVAHNQIYSQIVNARAVIADFSALNANVMIEIGIAMAEGQKVFAFYDNTRLDGSNVPFYLTRLV